jgi:hypothetical protein
MPPAGAVHARHHATSEGSTAPVPAADAAPAMRESDTAFAARVGAVYTGDYLAPPDNWRWRLSRFVWRLRVGMLDMLGL